MKQIALALWLVAAGCVALPAPAAPDFQVIPGSIPFDKGPDGNSIFLDAPDGLILVDTGRHPEHSAKLIAHARQRDRPIVAIVNTHWHLDHTTGNHDIRQAFPAAEVYGTSAIEGALGGFLKRGREQGDKALADPKTSALQRAQILRARLVLDNPERLRPTHPMNRSQRIRIAGRLFDIRVARFAVTEADLWLFDPKAKVAIVGDLVVDIVPFMDTACLDGWAKALDDIAATPFTTLIPGHGEPMSRDDFMQWRGSFIKLLACARSDVVKAECVARWKHDAARFIDEAHRTYVAEALEYYIDTRLRSTPAERIRYCSPLGT